MRWLLALSLSLSLAVGAAATSATTEANAAAALGDDATFVIDARTKLRDVFKVQFLLLLRLL